MKNIFQTFLKVVCLALLFSCSKEPTAAELNFFFKMKVDGVLREYNECRTWFGNAHQGEIRYYQMNIIALDDDLNLGGVFVNDAKPINKGLYTSEMIHPQANSPMAGLNMQEYGSDVYMSHFGSNYPYREAIVNIIEFNDKYVYGTFSGKVSLRGSDTVFSITEGEFKAIRDQ